MLQLSEAIKSEKEIFIFYYENNNDYAILSLEFKTLSP